MSSQVDKVVSIYRKLAQIPTLVGAKILRNGTIVNSYWSERNLETNKNTSILFTHGINKDLEVVSDSGFGIDIGNELAAAVSPLENFRAVIRDLSESNDKKKQFLEIWKHRQLKHSINVTALDVHGDVYADSEFSSFVWDYSEKYFMYIAEKKLPKPEPFYKRQPLKPQNKTENDELASKGSEYDYKPEWGEQLVGKHLSSIIICDVENETCKVVEGIPDHLFIGQVQWAPDGLSIVGVAWETEPRRLGLIFCTNRPGIVFKITLDGKFSTISTNGNAVRSPRFSTDGKQLIWLQRDVGGPHHGCHKLVKTSWPLEDEIVIKNVIDVIDDEISIEGNKKFTGIYAQGFSNRAFALDGKRVLFSTAQQTEIHSYVVDIDTGKITDISDSPMSYSTSILDINNDLVVASRTSFKQPTQLIIAKLPPAGEEQTIEWKVIEENNIEIPNEITNGRIELLHLKHENSQDNIKNFSALFFASTTTGNDLQPLIIYPHGGPHSAFVNAFSIESALYCMLGISMVQVNYRGSTGAGQNSLLYLLGRAGDADVKDCILTMEETVKKFPVDKQKCLLLGRSHGGFLVTHLSGQYPDLFKAVVAGNPVIDLVSMANSSDIPDWCYVEAGHEFNEVGPISEDILMQMRRASPLVHSHNVKAPTLLCLGSKDKRVPYFQGIEYYNRIRANGCKARMLIYEDNHALNVNRNIEIDHVINSALWFLENLE